MISRKHIFVPALLILVCSVFACQGKAAGTAAEADTLEYGMFGSIPQVYENEILQLVNLAKERSTGDFADILKRTFGDLADSAYHEAERKATPSALKMIGKTVGYDVEEGLDYQLTSDIKVLSAFMPVLQTTGGEERLAVQFSVKADTVARQVYYILHDETENIGCGTFKMKLDADSATFATFIPAPNIPAKYQNQCKQIRFVTKATYDSLSTGLLDQQKLWRTQYAEEHGLDIMNTIE